MKFYIVTIYSLYNAAMNIKVYTSCKNIFKRAPKKGIAIEIF